MYGKTVRSLDEEEEEETSSLSAVLVLSSSSSFLALNACPPALFPVTTVALSASDLRMWLGGLAGASGGKEAAGSEDRTRLE